MNPLYLSDEEGSDNEGVRCYYYSKAPVICMKLAKEENVGDERPYCSNCERRVVRQEKAKEKNEEKKLMRTIEKQERIIRLRLVKHEMQAYVYYSLFIFPALTSM